jgi:NAD(P) transhydrogenase
MSAIAYDLIVIGSGPAGQKAAVQGAKQGRRVAIIEQGVGVGGACVHHGTIPSKTLRETAAALASFRRRTGDQLPFEIPETLKVASLMARLDQVVHAHEAYIGAQLARNAVTQIHGRARFLSPHELEVTAVSGTRTTLQAPLIVIAVGSQPRTPPNVPVDHENILDSDSILSLVYLPRSLTVLGAGVVASVYASIFTALGVAVTMIDKGDVPLGFLDPELTSRFREQLEAAGGRFLGGRTVTTVATDGVVAHTTLDDGTVLTADKVLCALGRVAVLGPLNLAAAGLAPTARGLIAVDEHCRTAVPHIYAVGDVIGPPGLAASAMEQGRRAVCHALALDPGPPAETIPLGIYTIPEMSSVGITEAQAVARHGGAWVGRARFAEIARGHIMNNPEGFLKMVVHPDGETLLGVHIIGEGATEMIHLGQMALVAHCPVETFVENIFNFPTLAEAYRVAALDIVGQRDRLASCPPARTATR